MKHTLLVSLFLGTLSCTQAGDAYLYGSGSRVCLVDDDDSSTCLTADVLKNLLSIQGQLDSIRSYIKMTPPSAPPFSPPPASPPFSPPPTAPPPPPPPQSPPETPPIPLLDGTVFYSDMETMTADGKLKDMTGNRNHAVKAGTSAITPTGGGVAGSGAQTFPDASGYYMIPANAITLVSGSEPRSVCLWLKMSPDAPSKNTNYPFGMGTDCPGDLSGTSFNMRFSSAGKAGFMGCADDEFGIYGATTLSDDNWHHVCYVYERPRLTVYVDGYADLMYQKTLKTSSHTANGAVVTIGSHTGAALSGTGTNSGTNAQIDDFYILDKAISYAEVGHLRCRPWLVQGQACPYASSDGATVEGIRFYSNMESMTADGLLEDLSGGGNHAMKFGNPVATSSGVAGSGAFSLPAADGFFSIPANARTLISGSMPRSVCFWLKQSSGVVTSGDYPFGMGTDCPGDPPHGSSFNSRFTSGGQLGFMGCGDDEYGQYTRSIRYGDAFRVTDGTWRHVCYTYDLNPAHGSQLKIYVDGYQAAAWSKTLKTTAYDKAYGPPVVTIGTHTGAGASCIAGGSSDLCGANIMIDDFYIIDHAVSKSEMVELRCGPYEEKGQVCPLKQCSYLPQVTSPGTYGGYQYCMSYLSDSANSHYTLSNEMECVQKCIDEPSCKYSTFYADLRHIKGQVNCHVISVCGTLVPDYTDNTGYGGNTYRCRA